MKRRLMLVQYGALMEVFDRLLADPNYDAVVLDESTPIKGRSRATVVNNGPKRSRAVAQWKREVRR